MSDFHIGGTDGEAVPKKCIRSAKERGLWMNLETHGIRMFHINAEECPLGVKVPEQVTHQKGYRAN